MKLAYITSPLRGTIEENAKAADRYCEYAVGCGVVPLSSYRMFTTFLHDALPAQQEQELQMSLELLRRCGELWACGDKISQRMQGEISLAENLHIPTVYVLDRYIEESLKIRQEHEPLGKDNCIPQSHKMGYGNRVLVLNPESLALKYRNAENSLWIAYNGFGCTYGARGQAVFAKSLFSGEQYHWERSDFLGIVRQESLKQWLENTPIRNEQAQAVLYEPEQDRALEL
jgi:hypothetical protein